MKDFKRKSKFFNALREPIRLKIIAHLLEKERCICICELSKALRRDQSVIFRHVQLLKEVGIISTNKNAKFLMCCIKEKSRIKKLLEG